MVVDFVLDAFEGEVAFVLLEREHDRLLAVPPDAFSARGAELTLHLDTDKLDGARSLTRAELEARIADRAFLREHAHSAHQLTPLR